MKPTIGTKVEKEIEVVANWFKIPVPKTAHEEKQLLSLVAKSLKLPSPNSFEQRNILLKEVLKRGPPLSAERRAALRRIRESPAMAARTARVEEVPESEWKPTEIRDVGTEMDPSLRWTGITDYMERFLSPYPFDLTEWPTEILQAMLPEIDALPRRRKEVYLSLEVPKKILSELKARGKKIDEEYWERKLAELPERPPTKPERKPERVEQPISEIDDDEEEVEKPERWTGGEAQYGKRLEDYRRAAEERLGEHPKVANKFAEFLERRGADLSPESIERELKEFQIELAEQRVKEDRDVDELVSDYDLDPSDAFARREAREAGENVAPLISLDEFRNEWIKFHGSPQSESDRKFLEGSGIRDFYSDYITGGSNVQDYFRQIRSDIKEELLSKNERREEIQDLLAAGFRPSELKGLSEDLLLQKYYKEFKNELNFLERVKKN